MRIKLIFPQRPLRETETVIKHHLVPSETLTAIAAITPDRHTVEIVDENIQAIDWSDIPDVVGITVYTFLAPRAYELAALYRAKGAHVVLGGLHVTSAPMDALPHADTIFLGEAELNWAVFLGDLERGAARSIYGPAPVPQLDSLPHPDKDLLDKRMYLTTGSVSGSRGCPHRCDYCFNSVEPKAPFRRRSVGSIIDQLKMEGHRYVIFFDDNLTVDHGFATELCRELAKLRIRWRCAVSVDLAYDERLVEEMACGGCESVFVGFESINAGSLDESSKHHNRACDYPRLIKVFQHHELLINAAFVFGFDHDTPDVFRDTVDFAVANRLTSINFHILTPFPGTPLFKRLDAAGRILTYDWSKYDTGHVVFEPMHMTAQQLIDGYRWVYREFYSLGSIVRRIPQQGLRFGFRTLLFNLALKKIDPVWMLLRRLGLLSRAFQTYQTLERAMCRMRLCRAERAQLPTATPQHSVVSS